MATLIVYPETLQLRQVVTDVTRYMGHGVNRRSKQLPTLKFIGTVKLHGTNAAIVYQQNAGQWCQSRNRVITPNNDNAGFAEHMDSLAETFLAEHVLSYSSAIREYYEQDSTIVIYGEWCGSNIQDQANIAIVGLAKMFVIFKIKIINRRKRAQMSDISTQEKYKEHRHGFWLDPQEWSNIKWSEKSIYNIFDFPTYDIDIDFNVPELSQNKLTQITEDIEQQCPVGAYFHQTGCGEGVVWTEWKQTHGCLTFKVKGRKYSVTNSEILAPTHTLKLNSVEDFVEYACTNNRMQQAYDAVREELVSVETKDFNTFARWLAEDIIKEEKDTMDMAHIDVKDIARVITIKAQTWLSHRSREDRKKKKT